MSVGSGIKSLDVDCRIGGLENERLLFVGDTVVDRRIGGLEISRSVGGRLICVDRRIGGLENDTSDPSLNFIVDRRIGGLEMPRFPLTAEFIVDRRIGGLPFHQVEVAGEVGFCTFQCNFPDSIDIGESGCSDVIGAVAIGSFFHVLVPHANG